MAATLVHYSPAANVTVKAQSKLSAGTFVMIAADADGRNPVVKPATAKARAFGVAAHDCEAGKYVMVYRAGHVLTLTASGSINAGDPITTGASGAAAKATESDPVLGTAVSKAAESRVIVALG